MNLTRCGDCTIKSGSGFCPLASPPDFPCGFGQNEAARRRYIAMRYDTNTNTERKFLGRKHDDSAVPGM